MSTGLAKQEDKRTPAQKVRAKMVAMAPRVQEAIGNSIDAQRCLTIAAMAIEANQKLIECGQTVGGIQSLVQETAKMALFGLYCDGITGDAYLVPFKKNVAPRGQTPRFEMRAQAIMGYKGLRKLVARSGECEVVGETVHEGDIFTYNGPFSVPQHRRSESLTRRSDKLLGVYILARFTSGTHKCFYWSREECIAHRDKYSENWKNAVEWAKKDGRQVDPEKNNWHEENPGFPAMCLKTVIRWAINRGELPMSIEDKRRGAATLIDAEPELKTVDAIEAMEFTPETIDGEILDTDPHAAIVTAATEASGEHGADVFSVLRARLAKLGKDKIGLAEQYTKEARQSISGITQDQEFELDAILSEWKQRI